MSKATKAKSTGATSAGKYKHNNSEGVIEQNVRPQHTKPRRQIYIFEPLNSLSTKGALAAPRLNGTSFSNGW
jgi:hypothetical protein